MYGYIYKITNNINGKIYIGQHKATKFEPEVYRGSGKLLLQAYEKYGINNFYSELLCECCSQEELDAKEIKYIQEYDTTNLDIGYNLTPGGFGGCGPVSEETKEKLREATLGTIVLNNGVKMVKIQPEELEQYLAKGFVRGALPFTRTDAFKRNLSESTTGKRGMYRIKQDGTVETRWGYPEEFEFLLSQGWEFGWKPKIDNNEKKTRESKRHMYKDGEYKLVNVSDVSIYLADGWIFQCFTKGQKAWNKDQKTNDETRKKLSQAHIGEKHTPERIAKHADLIRGRIYMNKEGVNKLIPHGEEDFYRTQGWKDGRVSKQTGRKDVS